MTPGSNSITPYELGEVVDGRYELLGRLGSGGAGTVFRARRLDSLGEEVAVKLLNHGEAMAGRFELEARAIQRLKSPHTVKLLEFGRTGTGTPFMVLELLEGRTLLEAMRSGKLEPRQIIEILRQVALALEEAHERGLIHRDLKPNNIFLQRVGRHELTKVLDFGIAKLVDGSRTANLVEQTSPGLLFGTPAYMSPEQCSGGPIDPRSDLYSLGVIAFQALSGRLPFDRDTPVQLLYAHIHEQPPTLDDLLALRPDVPSDLVDLVHALLSKRPEARPADARAVVEALESLLDVQAVRPGSDDSTFAGKLAPTAATVRSRHRWSNAAFIVPGAIAGVLVGLMLLRAHPDPVSPAPVAALTPPAIAPPEVSPPPAPDPAPTSPSGPSPRRCRATSVRGAFGDISDDEAEQVTKPMMPRILGCARARGAERIDLRLRRSQSETRVAAKLLDRDGRALKSAQRFGDCVKRAAKSHATWPNRKMAYIVIEIECSGGTR